MLTRREFIQACMRTTVGFSLASLCSNLVAEAATKLPKKPVVLYLEANTCTGNLISLLNARDPDLARFIQEDIDLRFQTTLMAAEGTKAINYLYQSAEENWGEYILIVEGAVATRDNGRYGIIGEREDGPLTGLQGVRDLAAGAKYIVPFGVCACYGGHYATPPNPCGAKGVFQVLNKNDQQKVVNVSGCPGHPDWLLGTLTHLMVFGLPDLDAHRRPRVFFGRTVHDQCPRRSLFEKGIFASQPGDAGCLYKIGCKGPVAGCDVPQRQWNTYYHWQWPIGCNVPCIGCTEPGYPVQMMPFYQHLPGIPIAGTHTTSATVAKVVGGATGLAIASHLGVSLATGRVQENYRKLQQPLPPLPPEPTPSVDFPGYYSTFSFEFGDLPADIDQKPVASEPKQQSPATQLSQEIKAKWGGGK